VKVVVIGASYGGLYALMELLGALTTDFPCPIVVAQHRYADSLDEARLGDVLSRYSAVPVRDAEHGEPLAAPGVFLAPADYHLVVDDDHLELTVDELVEFSRPSIDVLFESAARAYGPEAVGVLLTGFGHDGSGGMTAIHAAGGRTIAQDPETALQPAMPRNAIDTGCVDEVLPLDAIPARLLELSGVAA
jgi:two-component system, chemotaxis family, protein-glutamate methylesterase/glutaminase